MPHLTEDKLYDLLVNLYGSEKVQRQFKIGKYRVDFLIDGKLAVEFDGYRHYCEWSTIDRDMKVFELLNNQGIELFHVPYFLQAAWVCEALGFNEQAGSHYPNGFIDKKALRPKDFSLRGLATFVLQLRTFSDKTQEEILITMDEIDMEAYHIMLKLINAEPETK